jgi:hypothetical protein
LNHLAPTIAKVPQGEEDHEAAPSEGMSIRRLDLHL